LKTFQGVGGISFVLIAYQWFYYATAAASKLLSQSERRISISFVYEMCGYAR